MARSDEGKKMGIHAGSKSASPLGSLRTKILWSFGCFLLETCSSPCVGVSQQLCARGPPSSLRGFVLQPSAEAFVASFSNCMGLLRQQVSSSNKWANLIKYWAILVEIVPTASGLFLSQHKYIRDLLAIAGMDGAKEVSTPMSTSDPLTLHDGSPPTDATIALFIIGYFFAVRLLSLQAYSDADWASNRDDRSSITSYLIYLGGNLISWSSHKQQYVPHFSIEAEYYAIACTATNWPGFNPHFASLVSHFLLVPLYPMIMLELLSTVLILLFTPA
ncbi:unnamed protein product [Prunus armeniaca]